MRTLKSQIQICGQASYGLLVAAGVIAVMFYVIGYRPQGRRLAELHALIARHEQELSEAQSQAKDLPSEARAVEQLKARLANFHKLPAEPQLGAFMRDITQVSQQSSLRKLVVQPGVPRRQDLYCELPVALQFEGDFLSVFSFLRQLEEMTRLTRVKNMQIHSQDTQHGQVQTQVSMDIYYAEG